MSNSFVCSIDGSPGSGKSTLLSGLSDRLGSDSVIIPEIVRFMPQMVNGGTTPKKGLVSLINELMTAERYRWELVQQAKKESIPFILIDTSFQHNICGNALGYIAKYFVSQQQCRQNEFQAPQTKSTGIKIIKPDLNVLLQCKDNSILTKRLHSRGSKDHASYVPHPLYQTAYNIGYKMLSPFMQKKNIALDVTHLNKNNVLDVAEMYIRNERDASNALIGKIYTMHSKPVAQPQLKKTSI